MIYYFKSERQARAQTVYEKINKTVGQWRKCVYWKAKDIIMLASSRLMW